MITDEFKSFMRPTIAAAMESELLGKLKSRLFPDTKILFLKILFIHIIVGLVSLLICNQFNLNPFQTSQSLSNWFMEVGGHHFCMLACGIFFMAATFIAGNFFISLEELMLIRKHQLLHSLIICLLSLFAFAFFGAKIFSIFGVLWLLGGLIGSLSTITSTTYLRYAF